MMENRIQDLTDADLIKHMNRIIDKYNESKLEQALILPTSKLYGDYAERIAALTRLFTKAFRLAVERGLYVLH